VNPPGMTVAGVSELETTDGVVLVFIGREFNSSLRDEPLPSHLILLDGMDFNLMTLQRKITSVPATKSRSDEGSGVGVNSMFGPAYKSVPPRNGKPGPTLLAETPKDANEEKIAFA
jgi:hypothetical protein